MSPNIMRAALLGGVALAALGASSVVAWKFGHAPELGRPWLFGWWYDPSAAWRWWQSWGHAEPYRKPFVQGLNFAMLLAMLLAILPAGMARLVEMYGPLQAKTRTDAGLGKPHELRKSGHIKTRGPGVALGRNGWRIFRSTGDQHVVAFGASGSGKTTTVGIPTALTYPGSMLVIDPSGAVAEITGRRRRSFGALHVFDPTKRGTARFNPLLELRLGDSLIGDCQMAACMVTQAEKGQGPKDPFWDRSSGYLLSGLLHHVRCSDEPTLGHVWRLLQAIDAKRYPADPTPFAKSILDGFKKHEPKLQDSIVATSIAHLQFLADPVVQHATAGSDFRAGDLQAADRPVTIAVNIPEDQAERLRPLTRLALQTLIKPLMSDRHLTSDGREKKRPTLVMIDDFPALGFMDLIETGLADARKYGLRFCLLAQGFEQIEKHYTGNQAITGNCGTWAVIPGLSNKTLKATIDLAGKVAVAQASKQFGSSWRSSSSTSQSETLRAALDPGEMIMRGKDELLILTANCRPTYLRKIPYWRMRAFRGLFDEPGKRVGPNPASTFTSPEQQELPPWLKAI